MSESRTENRQLRTAKAHALDAVACTMNTFPASMYPLVCAKGMATAWVVVLRVSPCGRTLLPVFPTATVQRWKQCHLPTGIPLCHL